MIVEVDADFSQFYIHAGPPNTSGMWPDDPDLNAGIVVSDGEGSLMFTSFQQLAVLPVDIDVLDAAPGPLGPEWQDVVEMSFTARGAATLTGWGADETTAELPLELGTSYRVRYAISDGDLARTVIDPPWPERYQIRLWPAPFEPWKVVVSDSARGRYWESGRAAAAAWSRVASLPGGTRTEAMIDIALREHPDMADKLRRGEDFSMALLAYAHAVKPQEVDFSEMRALIFARARALKN